MNHVKFASEPTLFNFELCPLLISTITSTYNVTKQLVYEPYMKHPVEAVHIFTLALAAGQCNKRHNVSDVKKIKLDLLTLM